MGRQGLHGVETESGASPLLQGLLRDLEPAAEMGNLSFTKLVLSSRGIPEGWSEKSAWTDLLGEGGLKSHAKVPSGAALLILNNSKKCGLHQHPVREFWELKFSPLKTLLRLRNAAPKRVDGDIQRHHEWIQT